MALRASIKIEEIKTPHLVQQNIVGIEVGVIHIVIMETRQGCAQGVPVLRRKALPTQGFRQGL